MERLRTTTLAPNDLVSPSTSMAIWPLLALSPGMAHTCRGLQGNGDGLAHAQILRPLGQGLDAKHQPRPLLLAVDDGRCELGLRRDEADACGEVAPAAVAAHSHRIADAHPW